MTPFAATGPPLPMSVATTATAGNRPDNRPPGSRTDLPFETLTVPSLATILTMTR
jgi:hypothetical protein